MLIDTWYNIRKKQQERGLHDQVWTEGELHLFATLLPAVNLPPSIPNPPSLRHRHPLHTGRAVQVPNRGGQGGGQPHNEVYIGHRGPDKAGAAPSHAVSERILALRQQNPRGRFRPGAKEDRGAGREPITTIAFLSSRITYELLYVNQVHKLRPFATHYVWVDGNNNGKMHRMREAREFVDPPSYYSEPGATGAFVIVKHGGNQEGSQGGEKGASFKSNRTDEEAFFDGREGFLSVDLHHEEVGWRPGRMTAEDLFLLAQSNPAPSSPDCLQTPLGFNEWRNVTEDTEKMVR